MMISNYGKYLHDKKCFILNIQVRDFCIHAFRLILKEQNRIILIIGNRAI